LKPRNDIIHEESTDNVQEDKENVDVSSYDTSAPRQSARQRSPTYSHKSVSFGASTSQ
jgi:hypothetical protein